MKKKNYSIYITDNDDKTYAVNIWDDDNNERDETIENSFDFDIHILKSVNEANTVLEDVIILYPKINFKKREPLLWQKK